MKSVTVYTAKKNQVVSYGDTIPYYTREPQPDISFEAGECFIKSTVEEIHLPISKFCWANGKEVFAAFDEELLELIGCLKDQKDREVATRVGKEVECIVAEKLSEFCSMSFWQRIKFAFTGRAEK